MVRAAAAAVATFGVVVTLLFAGSPARAGNDDGVLIGNEAALSGGAVTATVSDGNALWYNPAGFARVRRNTVDVNGSAFVLRIYDASPLIEADTGQKVDGNVVELVSVPSGISYVRPISDTLRLGYGIFVSESANFGIRERLELPGIGGRSEWVVTYNVQAQTYHGGAGLAYEISPTVRFGASLFLTYTSGTLQSQFSGGAIDAASGNAFGFIATSGRASVTLLGIETRVGVQWDFAEDWVFGASLRLPSAEFYTAVTVDEVEALAANGGGAIFVPTLAEADEWGFEVATPARLRLAFAHRLGPDAWIALDIDFQHPLKNDATGTDRNLLFNARLGGRFAIADDVSLGVGLFTDLSPYDDVDGFADSNIDFFGLTLGVEYATTHRLHASEETDSLAFKTAFGLRYAVGLGDVGGLGVRYYDPAVAPEFLVGLTTNDLTVHELGLHLGSALYF